VYRRNYQKSVPTPEYLLSRATKGTKNALGDIPRTPFVSLLEYAFKESDVIVVGKHCFIP